MAGLNLEIRLILVGFNTASGKHYCNFNEVEHYFVETDGFNTASGKHYCNTYVGLFAAPAQTVSIPQAVSTIAIGWIKFRDKTNFSGFQYRKR